MSLLIGDKVVVSMHYTLKNDEGEVIDTSEGRDPLNYLHGSGNIIPGLENALVGKTTGDKLDVRVEAAEGYGEVVPELVQTIDKSLFQGVDKVEEGMTFNAQGPNGQVQQVVVKAVEGDEVTIDANHPLAGVALNFSVEIMQIREASEEEVAHGHAH
ncbi:FKBP-type peptidyl-prolyl cis-trans isomerase [Aurantivibrio plasticivorans]